MGVAYEDNFGFWKVESPEEEAFFEDVRSRSVPSPSYSLPFYLLFSCELLISWWRLFWWRSEVATPLLCRGASGCGNALSGSCRLRPCAPAPA